MMLTRSYYDQKLLETRLWIYLLNLILVIVNIISREFNSKFNKNEISAYIFILICIPITKKVHRNILNILYSNDLKAFTKDISFKRKNPNKIKTLNYFMLKFIQQLIKGENTTKSYWSFFSSDNNVSTQQFNIVMVKTIMKQHKENCDKVICFCKRNDLYETYFQIKWPEDFEKETKNLICWII